LPKKPPPPIGSRNENELMLLLLIESDVTSDGQAVEQAMVAAQPSLHATAAHASMHGGSLELQLVSRIHSPLNAGPLHRHAAIASDIHQVFRPLVQAFKQWPKGWRGDEASGATGDVELAVMPHQPASTDSAHHLPQTYMQQETFRQVAG
jgi:hypothetical protein